MFDLLAFRRLVRCGAVAAVVAAVGAAVGMFATTAAASPWDELIARDLRDGAIDRTTAAWYLLYAVRDRDRLPAEYRSAANQADRLCATPALVYLHQREADLSASARAELARLEVRPPSTGFISSSSWPFRVHWQDSTQIAQAEVCLALLEECWQVEIGAMGFTAPPPDGGAGGSDDFDFYLDGEMAPGNGFSEGEIEDPTTWWFDRASFVVIGASTPEPLLRVLIAHEFNHSCQWAMDAAEDDAFYENTSSFVEELVYDWVNDVYNVLPAFQDYPHRSLDYFGEVYQYGAFLWEAFLADAYGDGGGAIIRDLWNASRQASVQNEPDYFDVLESVLPEGSGDDFDAMYVKFAQWRFFTGDRHDEHHFEEAYPEGVHLEQTFGNGTIPFGGIAPAVPPMEYGATYHLFLPGASPAPGDLRVALSATAQKRWSISLLGFRGDGGPPALAEARSEGGVAECVLPHREQYAGIVLVTANLGDGQHDPDADEWSGTSFVLWVSLLPAGSSVPAATTEVGPRLALESANPIRGEAWVGFSGLAGSDLVVWDVYGRWRRTLAIPAGQGRARLDARDDRGRPLPAGIYWIGDARGAARPVRMVVAR